jgi:hypothetical protein
MTNHPKQIAIRWRTNFRIDVIKGSRMEALKLDFISRQGSSRERWQNRILLGISLRSHLATLLNVLLDYMCSAHSLEMEQHVLASASIDRCMQLLFYY